MCTSTPMQAHGDPGFPGRKQNRGCCHRVRHPFLTQVTALSGVGAAPMRSRPPRTPSLSLTVAMTSPVGGSQAHRSCSHGTLGSEAVGDFALVPRSSRSDLSAGQQEALRPGMCSGGRGGSSTYTPGPAGGRAWRGLAEAGGSLPGTQAGPRGPKGQGRVRPGETRGTSTGLSPHSAELPAPTGAAATETPGAAQAPRSLGRSAALMWPATKEQAGGSKSSTRHPHSA